jgi:hypothetical protein
MFILGFISFNIHLVQSDQKRWLSMLTEQSSVTVLQFLCDCALCYSPDAGHSCTQKCS